MTALLLGLSTIRSTISRVLFRDNSTIDQTSLDKKATVILKSSSAYRRLLVTNFSTSIHQQHQGQAISRMAPPPTEPVHDESMKDRLSSLPGLGSKSGTSFGTATTLI
ncbi:hypothetical protein CLAIMM_05281 [Cladophialophora immunda]|nr:hypothetical protein CLAIMM_05281 [Cladophialophora immunda]